MKGVVGKITSGAADAGFVYVTDAIMAGDDVEAIESRGGAGERRVPDRRGRRLRERQPRRSSSTSCSARTARPLSRTPASGRHETGVRDGLAVAAGLALAFLLLPILALFVRISPSELLDALWSDVASTRSG